MGKVLGHRLGWTAMYFKKWEGQGSKRGNCTKVHSERTAN